jgi:hypothetical protein
MPGALKGVARMYYEHMEMLVRPARDDEVDGELEAGAARCVRRSAGCARRHAHSMLRRPCVAAIERAPV